MAVIRVTALWSEGAHAIMPSEFWNARGHVRLKPTVRQRADYELFVRPLRLCFPEIFPQLFNKAPKVRVKRALTHGLALAECQLAKRFRQ